MLPLINFLNAKKSGIVTYSYDFVFIFLSVGTAAPMPTVTPSTGTKRENDTEIIINYQIHTKY